ncbi:hypothetical protein MOQ72_19545 [Saccharopolyspora sp. K220]|uniref:sigma factor n=1 Tax=Saccharopolyspora soli TaxID=2926618 RepID=UPI001F592281|nr:sigma factor [Saccharopolyspora soli]MCI2419645.1 hypothetical protein [Saccharopolyspora soli]
MRAEQEQQFREFAGGRALWLRRSAYLLCGGWHLAEDLVQNTFLELYRAWRRIDSYNYDPIIDDQQDPTKRPEVAVPFEQLDVLATDPQLALH